MILDRGKSFVAERHRNMSTRRRSMIGIFAQMDLYFLVDLEPVRTDRTYAVAGHPLEAEDVNEERGFRFDTARRNTQVRVMKARHATEHMAIAAPGQRAGDWAGAPGARGEPSSVRCDANLVALGDLAGLCCRSRRGSFVVLIGWGQRHR